MNYKIIYWTLLSLLLSAYNTAFAVDTDGDLIDDNLEVMVNTDPHNILDVPADTDADGIPDLVDYDAGNSSIKSLKTPVFETGSIDILGTIDNGVFFAISMDNDFVDPVVLATVTSLNSSKPIDVRVRSVSGVTDSFEIFLERPDGIDHDTSETINYMVVERGTWALASGVIIEAGSINTSSSHISGAAFSGERIEFAAVFAQRPIVISTLNSYNNADFMSTQHYQVTPDDFFVTQEVAGSGSDSGAESIAWLAISAGSDVLGGFNVERAREYDGAKDGITDAPHIYNYQSPGVLDTVGEPWVLADTQTIRGGDGGWARTVSPNASNVHIYTEEDTVLDSEQTHADEEFGVILFDAGARYWIEDSNANGVADSLTTDVDINSNGIANAFDKDDDNDGVNIPLDGNRFDGLSCNIDNDADGLDDCSSGQYSQLLDGDYDADGLNDELDHDDDNDGVIDINDSCPRGVIGTGSVAANGDADGDGCDAAQDTDKDGDGVLDISQLRTCTLAVTEDTFVAKGDSEGDAVRRVNYSDSPHMTVAGADGTDKSKRIFHAYMRVIINDDIDSAGNPVAAQNCMETGSPLPKGVSVSRAQLIATSQYNVSGFLENGVYRVLNAWFDDTLVWNNRPPYDPTIRDKQRVVKGKLQFDVSSDVQAFLNSDTSNYGWVIREPKENNVKRLDSTYYASDYAFEALRPVLKVEYSVGGSGADTCPLDATTSLGMDSDGDGLCDGSAAINAGGDSDDDNDGIDNASDLCPLDADAANTNFDGDHFCDASDSDDDNDGVDDADELAQGSNPFDGIDFIDNTPPVINFVQPGVIAAVDASGATVSSTVLSQFLASVTAVDNVDGVVSVQHDIPNVLPIGATLVTLTATDNAGNQAREVFHQLVLDKSPPMISLLGENSVTVPLGGVYTDAGATAVDNVAGDLTANISVVNGVNVNAVGSYDVRYSVSDGFNTSTIRRSVVVQNAAAPVISVPDHFVLEVADSTKVAVNHHEIVNLINSATALDAQDGVITEINNDLGTRDLSVSTFISYSVIFSAVDSDGNIGTAESDLHIVDTVAPVVTLKGSENIFLTVGDTYTDPGATALDGAVDVSGTVDVYGLSDLDTSKAGIYTLQYIASDSFNNFSIPVSRRITVNPVGAPVLTVPAPITVNADSAAGTLASQSEINDFLNAATGIDYIDGDVGFEVDYPNIFPIGVTVVTFTAVDSASTISMAQSTVTVLDSDVAAPVVTAPADLVVAAQDANGIVDTNASVALFLASATASDVVDGVLTSIVNDGPEIFPLGDTIVTFSVDDTAGNTGVAMATVSVVDQSAPVISLLGDDSLTLSVGEVYADAGATAFDNVDGDITMNIAITGSVDINAVGLYSLSYSVSDAAGNAAKVIRSVSVQDAFAPVVKAPDNIKVAAVDSAGIAASDSQIAAFLSVATATDDVDGVIALVQSDAPAQLPIGATTVTFSAMDSAGNTGQAQATVSVIDQDAPVLNLLGSISITLESGGSYSEPGFTAMDNVDGNVSANVVVLGSVDTAKVGLYILHYSVMDAAGNMANTLVRSVTVQDSAAPVVTPPTGIETAAENANGIAVTSAAISAFLLGATAMDTLDGAISTVEHNAPAIYIPLGLTLVNFSATDGDGNVGQAQSIIHVTDQTAPAVQLNGASSVVVVVGDSYVDAGATATDNVDASVAVQVAGSVDSNAIGNYSLSYSATDSAGNSATVIRMVTVQANSAPIISVPTSIIVSAESAAGTASAHSEIAGFIAAVNASDTEDGGGLLVSNNAPANFPLGLTVVTFSATDRHGLTGSSQATVTIADQSPPVITLLGEPSISLTVGEAYTEVGAKAVDDIDGDLTANIVVVSNVNTGVAGEYTVTYRVEDGAGNQSSAVRDVVVEAVSTGSSSSGGGAALWIVYILLLRAVFVRRRR